MDARQMQQSVDSGCIYIPQSRPVNTLEQDVRQGLLHPPRSLPPKYFYDETGSRLFDQICDTRDYYPTRTEAAMLDQWACEIIHRAAPAHILEFGSGTSRKTRHLIDACQHMNLVCEYLPFDVCEAMLLEVRQQFDSDYPWLSISPLVGDYTAGLQHLHRPENPCLYVFLGSSIGNFTRAQARVFMQEVRTCMRPGDTLLLGVDRVKDPQVLQRAYNDSQGITARFNLNLLQVLNQRLEADFDTDGFMHQAEFNTQEERIEMYLVSQRPQQVELTAMQETLQLQSDEKLLTEISQKYTYEGAEALFTDAGLKIREHYQADNGYFSLILGEYA